MKSRGIVNLPVRSLIPHPENPRKDLGDLTEMSESIKKNGVLQNLTVIPKNIDGEDCNCNDAFKYMVIIGHRRLAAAQAAGVDQVPCRIVEGMTHDEQLLTMLEENMQRSDLTPYDQAQGFQLMLDLGQTVEDIEEKSGFSKATIYHRLNMAKLDKEIFKKKVEDSSFQLQITDLIELEKIKDINKRNEILKRVKSSSELKFQANQAAREETRLENQGKIIAILEGLGIKELPQKYSYWRCDKRYDIPYAEYGNVEIDVVEGEELYYYKNWDSISVYAPPEEDDSTAYHKDSPTAASTSSKAYDKYIEAKDKLKQACDRFVESRKDTIIEIALGNLKPTNEETAGKALWQSLLEVGMNTDLEEMTGKWQELNNEEPDPDEMDDEELADNFESAKTTVFELSFPRQCALILSQEYFCPPVNVYDGEQNMEWIEKYKVIDKALQNYGFTPSGLDDDLLKKDGEIVETFLRRKKEYQG